MRAFLGCAVMTLAVFADAAHAETAIDTIDVIEKGALVLYGELLVPPLVCIESDSVLYVEGTDVVGERVTRLWRSFKHLKREYEITPEMEERRVVDRQIDAIFREARESGLGCHEAMIQAVEFCRGNDLIDPSSIELGEDGFRFSWKALPHGKYVKSYCKTHGGKGGLDDGLSPGTRVVRSFASFLRNGSVVLMGSSYTDLVSWWKAGLLLEAVRSILLHIPESEEAAEAYLDSTLSRRMKTRFAEFKADLEKSSASKAR